MGFILASASPRRRELLKMAGITDFKVITADIEERSPRLSPGLSVAAIALDKAQSVAVQCTDSDIVIAADTLVYAGSEALGKPLDESDAVRMLKKLAGNMHTVYTGIALVRGGISVSSYEATKVFFRELSEREIQQYIKTGEPFDKAGAYAAQGKGAVFIERIEGDFFNVVGLPLCRLSLMLRDLGVII